MIACELFNQCI